MIGKSIFDILKTDATVSGFVGTKIFPIRTPQDTAFPFLIYLVEGNEPHPTKDDVSKLDVYSFLIAGFSNTYDELQDVMQAVRSVLDRYGGTNKGNVIDKINYEGEKNGYDDKAKVFFNEQSYEARIKL